MADGSHNHSMHDNGDTMDVKVEQKADSLVPQTICPVMGSKINKKLYVDYKGQRIYVCCRACIAPLRKDPEKYIKLLEAKGQAVEIIKKKGE
jgi:YHS domain-containing protein